MKKIYLFLLMVCFAGTLQAADSNGKFAVKGIGNSTCKTYVKEVEKGAHNAYLYAGWINGYLTGQNQQLHDTFDLVPWETINTLGEYLVGYCKKNPEKSFYMAISSMLGGIYEHRVKSFSPAVTVRSEDGDAVRVYGALIERMQTTLSKKGLYKGAVNGQYDSETLKAVKAFQKKAGLPANGVPDQDTLYKLLPKE